MYMYNVHSLQKAREKALFLYLTSLADPEGVQGVSIPLLFGKLLFSSVKLTKKGKYILAPLPF